MRSWAQFRIRDLVAAVLVICVTLAWWVERSQRSELAQSLLQLGHHPWIRLSIPSIDEKMDVGIRTMTVAGRAFFPSNAPQSPAISLELLSGSEVLHTSACETRRIDSRAVDFSGEARVPKIPPGLYFLNIKIVDPKSGAVLAAQGRAIEFVDALAQQENAATERGRD